MVTSRQTDIEQATRDYAAKHFPGVFTELHFGNHFGKTGGKMSKPDMCKNIGAVRGPRARRAPRLYLGRQRPPPSTER